MHLKHYARLLRLVAAACALLLWFVSIAFSNQGFGFEVPGWSWVGFVLSIAITVLELVFNRDGLRHNLTLAAVGLSAYAYGIYTNVVGILLAQGLNPDRMFLDRPLQILFPVLVGLMLEVVPETLLLWALFGGQVPDLLSELLLGMVPTQPGSAKQVRRGKP